MMPEVMLLKIDQMANNPIPITAKTDENITAKSCARVPKINGMMMSAIKNNVTETYLLIKWMRAMLMPFLLEIFLISVVKINRTISKKRRRNPVKMNSSVLPSKNLKNFIVCFFVKIH